MNKSPFLRRLSHVAPRKRGNPDKPRNARERLARRNASKARAVSFYDSGMGTARHVLASRLRFWVSAADRGKPDVIAREAQRAEVTARETSRRAWHSRCGLRLSRSARIWARRRAGWMAGPATIPHDVRPRFPRYGAYYLRTMRADASRDFAPRNRGADIWRAT